MDSCVYHHKSPFEKSIHDSDDKIGSSEIEANTRICDSQTFI